MKYNIKITNETHLDNIGLKRLIRYSLETFNKYYFIKHRNARVLNVKILYRKRNARCLGRAWLNTRTMKLLIDKGAYLDGFNDESSKYWAQIIWHELEHCEGKHHKQMRNHWNTPYPIPWSNEITVGVKKQKEETLKTPDMKITNKLISLENRRKNWESKLKRAQNSLKTINRQLTYYNNRMAAMKENK